MARDLVWTGILFSLETVLKCLTAVVPILHETVLCINIFNDSMNQHYRELQECHPHEIILVRHHLPSSNKAIWMPCRHTNFMASYDFKLRCNSSRKSSSADIHFIILYYRTNANSTYWFEFSIFSFSIYAAMLYLHCLKWTRTIWHSCNSTFSGFMSFISFRSCCFQNLKQICDRAGNLASRNWKRYQEIKKVEFSI